jgi:uncharacterized protein (DUF608 family)
LLLKNAREASKDVFKAALDLYNMDLSHLREHFNALINYNFYSAMARERLKIRDFNALFI